MLEPGDGEDLALEPLDAERLAYVGCEDLERDPALVADIQSEVDGRGGSLAEHVQDGVPALEIGADRSLVGGNHVVVFVETPKATPLTATRVPPGAPRGTLRSHGRPPGA